MFSVCHFSFPSIFKHPHNRSIFPSKLFQKCLVLHLIFSSRPQQLPDNTLALPAALANILATPSEPLPDLITPTLLEPPHPPEFPANIQRYPQVPPPQGFPPAYNPADFSYAPFAPPPPSSNTEYRDYNRDERPHRDDRHREDRHERYNDRRDHRYKRDDRDRRGREKICNFFAMPRGCRLGNKCSFLHVPPQDSPSHNGRVRERERDSTFT